MSRRLPRQSLLDCDNLPIAQLARIAMREGVRPRAAYQAHKWFARRFGITARALLVAAAAPSGQSFWRAFYQADSWVDRTVLDPFVGGGVMLLEARRLGAKVHGVDIEPVAAAIAQFQTQLRELPDLAPALERLIAVVGKEMAPFYETEDENGSAETLLHAFWVQRVKCHECHQTFDAHPTFRVAWDEATGKQWIACRGCSRLLSCRFSAQRVTCSCGEVTQPEAGHSVRGELQCPYCDASEQLIDYSRRTKAVPTFRMFAVETLHNGDVGRVPQRQRRLRSSNATDLRAYVRAEQKLNSLLRKRPKLLPAGRIPTKGRSDSRLLSYGYRDYRQLFNARQQLHLALLGQALEKEEGAVRHALAIAFSDHLTTNNMMCAYAGGWRRLTPLFSIRAYRHIARPVELNPWLRNNGRGTFPNAVRSVVRAAAALKSPTEPVQRSGGVRPVIDSEPGESDIRCGDARNLSRIASKSVNLVLTDPPYFDYISYSELGHFFTPWLARFGLIKQRLAKAFPTGQLASSARSHAAERRFAQRLARAFQEINRVCREDGRVVFTFQNLDGRGWHAIAVAMAKAGITPIRTFPLFGDSSASLHKHAQSISWDCVVVCRLGETMEEFSIGDAARESGIERAKIWRRELKGKGLPVTKGDETNIGHACSIVAEFELRGRIRQRSVTAKRTA